MAYADAQYIRHLSIEQVYNDSSASLVFAEQFRGEADEQGDTYR